MHDCKNGNSAEFVYEERCGNGCVGVSDGTDGNDGDVRMTLSVVTLGLVCA